MKDLDGIGFPLVEWDSFVEEQVLTSFEPSPFIPNGAKKIKMWRDEDYILHGKIFGSTDINTRPSNKKDRNALPGTIVKPIEFVGFSDSKRFKFRVKCHDTKSTRSSFFFDEGVSNYEADFSPLLIEKVFLEKSKTICLIDWYLNGTDEMLCFPDNISRTKEIVYKTTINDNLHMRIKGLQGEDSSCLFINLKEYKFLVKKVPKNLGPEWSNSISIEYRTEWGKIPDENERKAISEILGFLIGRELFNVGFTEFDKNNCIIKSTAFRIRNNKTDCMLHDEFPIPINIYENWKNVSNIISKLIDNYLEKKDCYHLDKAIWDFWIAQSMPIPTKIAVLFSGIETMCKCWFESSASPTKGVLIPREIYFSLMEDIFKDTEKALEDSKNKEKILNKIKTAYEISATRRIPLFLEEIGLPCGKVEEKVMIKRHNVVHGDKLKDEEIEDWLRITRAANTFFCRILLKLLDYSGDYYDYGTIGFPLKNIDEPIG